MFSAYVRPRRYVGLHVAVLPIKVTAVNLQLAVMADPASVGEQGSRLVCGVVILIVPGRPVAICLPEREGRQAQPPHQFGMECFVLWLGGSLIFSCFRMLVGPKLPQLARSLDEDPAPMALNRVHRTNGPVGHDARHCGLVFLFKLDRPLRHLQSGVLLRMHNPGCAGHTWE
ncbi:hypothetical protein BT67DRAFT_185604 [Trichocladium antarcticum]|uniref:Uncharacterized protein n=1 Tax=Trichocladium antarcticum TaxID=1450529 RepID=A0AAN6ZGG2_9PEZI|nr:hypothetical protein BT67DRAFT_185604 [Trichocladium antarcticum]